MKTTYEIVAEAESFQCTRKGDVYVERQSVECIFPNPRFNWRECLCNRGVYRANFHVSSLDKQHECVFNQKMRPGISSLQVLTQPRSSFCIFGLICDSKSLCFVRFTDIKCNCSLYCSIFQHRHLIKQLSVLFFLICHKFKLYMNHFRSDKSFLVCLLISVS